MSTKIDHLSIEELVNLNRQVVSRIKELRAQEQFKAASRFKIGEVVSFQSQDKRKVIGLIMSIRKATISVLSDDNKQWTVSASLLEPEEAPSKDLLEMLNQFFPLPSSSLQPKPLQKDVKKK